MMKINICVLIIWTAVNYIDGLSLQCRPKIKKPCGNKLIDRGSCISLGCCYSWLWIGMSCFHQLDLNNLRRLNRQQASGRSPSALPQTQSTTSPPPNEQLTTSAENQNPICVHDGPRSECGFPGISPTICLNRGCCWNATALGKPWCFHLTRFQSDQVQLPSHHSPPSSNSNGITRTRNSTQQHSDSDNQHRTNKIYNASENSNNEFYQVKTTLSVISTTSSTPSRFMTESNMRDLLLHLQLLLPQTNQSAATSESPIANRASSLLEEQSQSFHRVFQFLRLINDLKKAKSSSLLQPVCAVHERDSCCVINPSLPCCGFKRDPTTTRHNLPSARVVGGTPARHLRSSVAFLSKAFNRRHFCGGTLIKRQWVLTAAHCVLKYCGNERVSIDLIVSLGKFRKHPYARDYGQQDFWVTNVVCHPNQCISRDRPRINDVALLRLFRPASYSLTVQVALLPNPFQTPSIKRKCFALGWGNTRGTGYDDVIKQVSVPILTNDDCNHPDWRNCIVKSCMICAGDVRADLCDGDSGGPLFCEHATGLYVLHGVYSWGRCGATSKKPSIYSRTSHFVEWINEVTDL